MSFAGIGEYFSGTVWRRAFEYGNTLRVAVAAETKVDMLAKEYIDSGKLVLNEFIVSVVSGELLSHVFSLDSR